MQSNIFDRTSDTVTVVIDAFDDGSIKISVPQFSTVDMVLVDGEDGMMHIFMAVWSKFTF
ncbi:MAG: hypothetical protein EA446_02265 [Nitrosopumilus sp.]|nr:MAG: hypothetical protein EA446_02265 [Nitrosopumilus sp.]